MKGKQWKKFGVIFTFLAVAALALSGCSGSDGAAGAAGAAGATGPTGPTGPAGSSGATLTGLSSLTAEQLESLTLSGGVTSVTIASPPVVNFWVKDAAGKGVVGLDAISSTTPANLAHLRFTIAKLVPGENGSPDKWVSYMVTDTSRPTTERVAANLVSHGDGTYTYTFAKDLATVPGVTYDATAKHRLAIRISSSPIVNPAVIFYDWIPATGALVAEADQRNITSKAACNSCHGAMYNTAHGTNYVDTKMCVLCHNDQQRLGQTNVTSTGGVFTGEQTIADGEVLADMPVMIHKIHGGSELTKTGYNFADILFNDMGYPQEVINCRKCHNSDVGTGTGAQGGNWKTRPSRLACGACHDNVNFATGDGHGLGGIRTDDSVCAICHDALNIETNHLSVNATTNNPSVPTGATNFTYEISSLTVNASNQPVVKFRIMAVTPPATTATPVTFVKSTGTGGVNPLTGFTGAPSFLVAYAMPQDGITAPADFNNLGNGVLGAQPVSVSIAKLCDTAVDATTTTGTQGSMTGPDASGYYTATLNGPSTTIRESTYVYQIADGSVKATTATSTTAGTVVVNTLSTSYNAAKAPAVGSLALPAMPANPARFPATAKMRTVVLQGYFTQVTPAGARHATMVMKAVSGEERRLVVDSAKCAQCHEYFEGHGGNRNYNMDGCTVCHNTNLSSSGTIINDPTAPEATQNLKDMVHGIHAGDMRTNAYEHTRSKSGINSYYDWSEVVYPNERNNCLSCHLAGTYGDVPTGVLATTDVTPTNGTSIFDARTKLPNVTDIVISPYSAACVACHDSDTAKAHMTLNGGQLSVLRPTLAYPSTESCGVCHGAGKIAGVDVVH